MSLYFFAFIMHLVGFALGVGGATVSDVTFFKSIKDQKITAAELGFLKTVSAVVWTGLIIQLISGPAMVWLNYLDSGSLDILQSARFQAKLTMVGIILINGIVFQLFVFPFLRQNVGKKLLSKNIGSKIWLLAVTGTISIVSWYSVLIVSVFPRNIELEYWQFMGAYLVILLFGFIAARLMLGSKLSAAKAAVTT